MQILSCKLTAKQEFIGALNRILNYSRRGKHRRAMASRHSSAASHSRSSISAVSRGDTYLSETHCKLRRSAAVGQESPHPLLVPQSGTDYHPQHHTGCVSPPSGNYMGGGSHVPTAALLRSLQWVFIIYVPLRGTRSSNSICWSFVGAWLRRDAIAS